MESPLVTATRAQLGKFLSSDSVRPRLVNALQSTFWVPDLRDCLALKEVITSKAPCEVPQITISSEDVVVESIKCIYEARCRPIIHYPAHLESPGGQWWKEEADLETDLCLRSTLSLSLVERSRNYPLSPWSLLYCPDTFFFRDSQGKMYKDRDTTWLPVMASGVRNRLNLKRDGHLRTGDARHLREYYQGLFFMAEQFRHDAVILYGLAGVDDLFGYPLEDVALALASSVQSTCLKHIVLCVPFWEEKQREVVRRLFKKV